MPPLFRFGKFTLHSGEVSEWKIDCDALTQDDWDALAGMAASLVHPFGAVYDCGGASMQFAAALREYSAHNSAPLVVDDVFTTGRTMQQVRMEVLPKGAAMSAKGLVVFARHEPPPWIRAMFQWTGE